MSRLACKFFLVSPTFDFTHHQVVTEVMSEQSSGLEALDSLDSYGLERFCRDREAVDRFFLPQAFSGHFDFLRGALEVGRLGAASFNLLQGVCVIRAYSIL